MSRAGAVMYGRVALAVAVAASVAACTASDAPATAEGGVLDAARIGDMAAPAVDAATAADAPLGVDARLPVDAPRSDESERDTRAPTVDAKTVIGDMLAAIDTGRLTPDTGKPDSGVSPCAKLPTGGYAVGNSAANWTLDKDTSGKAKLSLHSLCGNVIFFEDGAEW